jgi:hypothetical protein
LRGKSVFCLSGSWIPLLFLKDEGYDWGIASNTGMNELSGYLGVGRGRCGTWKWTRRAKFYSSQSSLTSFGRCYLFTSRCSYYSVILSIQYFCFVLRNHKFKTMFLWY